VVGLMSTSAAQAGRRAEWVDVTTHAATMAANRPDRGPRSNDGQSSFGINW